MDSKPEENDTVARDNTASPVTNGRPSVVPAGSWEEYLTGKQMSADRFLSRVAKNVVSVPDQVSRDRFAEAIFAKPARIKQLIALLQTSATANTTIRQIVSDLTMASMRRLGVILPSESLTEASFQQSISAWLERITAMPLKGTDLSVLLLALNFGVQARLVEDNEALEFIARAVRKRTKHRGSRAISTRPTRSPLGVILTAAPVGSILAALVAHSEALDAQTNELNKELASRSGEVLRLEADCTALNITIANLRTELREFEEAKAKAENRISELGKQIVDQSDGWQHKLEEVRGRMRGVMQGQLTRWLQTALDAARSDPPYIKAVEERLEDALRTISGELQWLHLSD